MAELLDSIPEAAREELETYLNEDLRRAIVTTTTPIVDEDGRIYFDEIALRLVDGRKVAIVPEMRGKWPMLVLEINPGDGWRDMTVEEDYSEELEELTAAPGHQDADRRWENLARGLTGGDRG
ncbi:MAG: hypothetical protein GX885_10985 [Methanomicrobiales archaeon]|nr:hypothetical protein [Methanomicrobiales archaeon]